MARTILVVDDNPLVRDVVRSMLETRGYKVIVAADGEIGVRMYTEQGADVALVDVDMPRMNGVDACRALRSHASSTGRTLPVWLMTGVRDPDLVARAAAAGACDVLAKPFTTDELVACFESEYHGQPAISR